jgi:D-glycero-D-manno-heptose 1,7-bisphosphate phosphatase
MRQALFLDRDGVINVDHGYVHTTDQVDFVNGIFELVKFAKKANFLVIIISNQAGIGRGYYTEEEFLSLMEWMKDRFAERDGLINAVYYSPFHPEHGIGEYKRESECRKPNPGMLLQAKHDFDINMEQSLLIGDKISDIMAGRSAGVGKLLLYEPVQKMNKDFVTIHDISEALPVLFDLAKVA